MLTGSAWSDLIFGGDGDDFVNGGAGADKFFHVGVEGHGSDRIHEYDASEGDRHIHGGGEGPATADDFLIQTANTAGTGDIAIDEVFVTHVPSGNLLWALGGREYTDVNQPPDRQ